jgi:hypothetical protein
MSARVFAVAGLIVAGLLGARDARADVVYLTAHGTVSLFTGQSLALPFGIANGEQFTLTLKFDDDMQPLGPPTPPSVYYSGGFIEATLQFANGSVPLSFLFRTDINGRYYTEVWGNITSVEFAPVPLPGAAGLFSLALLGLARLRRRAA